MCTNAKLGYTGCRFDAARADDGTLIFSGVVLDKSFGAPRITKDGVTVAKEIELSEAWFRIRRFWVTHARGNRRPTRAGFQFEGCLVREAAILAGSGPVGLKRSQTKQGEPVRMALSRHQFARAFAVTLGTPTAHEAPMVQEELQQG
jgi:hypothetical protein